MNIRESMDSIFEKLDKASPVAILLQYNPDPDAMGTAAGFAAILKHVYELNSKIYYHGEISHPMNRSMKNVLAIPMKEAEEFDAEKHSAFVAVDTDLTGSGFKVPKLHVRIDHHSHDRDDAAELEHVEPMGSAATILWKYFQTFEFPIADHPLVATALLLAVKTDTLDFTSKTTTNEDIEFHKALLTHVDHTALREIQNYSIPPAQFELEHKAFTNQTEKNGVLVSSIGEINPMNRDAIAIIADRLSRLPNINTVVIMACLGDDIHASVRSTSTGVNVEQLVHKVYGKDHSGAKDGSGGARVSIGESYRFIDDDALVLQIKEETVRHFEKKIFSHLGEDQP